MLRARRATNKITQARCELLLKKNQVLYIIYSFSVQHVVVVFGTLYRIWCRLNTYKTIFLMHNQHIAVRHMMHAVFVDCVFYLILLPVRDAYSWIWIWATQKTFIPLHLFMNEQGSWWAEKRNEITDCMWLKFTYCCSWSHVTFNKCSSKHIFRLWACIYKQQNLSIIFYI